MSTAPPALLEARRILLGSLDMNVGIQVGSDLDPGEVGIVGDAAHTSGYHIGADRISGWDYSVNESVRDKTGLSNYASALDIGEFSAVVDGKTNNLRTFNSWLLGQIGANAADTRDIREVIYSLDGVTVKRWDRLGRRSTGDPSHRTHTHMSFFRDSQGRTAPELMTRYLNSTGLIDMTPEQAAHLRFTTDRVFAIAQLLDEYQVTGLGTEKFPICVAIRQLQRDVAELKANAGQVVLSDEDLDEITEAAKAGSLTSEQVTAAVLNAFREGTG